MNDSENQSIKTLWKNKDLRKNLIVCGLIWSAAQFNGYIVGFYVKYFPGNLFTNSFALAISDIAASIVSGLLIKQLRQSRAIITCLLIEIIGALLYLFQFNYLPMLMPLFIMLCRVGNSMLINVLYITNI